MLKKYTVLVAALLLNACSLNPAFAAAPKKASPVPPPPAVECAPLMAVLDGVNDHMPIATAMAVKAEVGDRLRDWVGKMPPVDKTRYDLVIIVAHTDGQYGVLVGWKKDPKLAAASLCVGILVTPERVAEFERITGLKPSDNPAKPKDDGSI